VQAGEIPACNSPPLARGGFCYQSGAPIVAIL
jgi:hypothetical protein